MISTIKKNYFLLISTFLILYFLFNLFDGERGLFSYFKKKKKFNKKKKKKIKKKKKKQKKKLKFLKKKKKKKKKLYIKKVFQENKS